ncbi:LGFP repeat-containing protein, partial [Blastococcus sp. SYSU D00695]
MLAAACLAALVVGGGLPSSPTGPALVPAADMSQFRAGNIISDQLFFDGNAMSAPDVQAFLVSKNPRCVAGSDGTPCLKDYRMDTTTKPADASCRGTYQGAGGETAATIIAKVGQACGISQRVLLVILQKEQGLVTATGSSLYARRYREAMGFACPDTAPCNPAYNGFFNQVYSAASRYRYYADNPTRFNHRAGAVNQIRFDVEADCGSSGVFIENQATAGLYNYTPYQPNPAALAAGRGTGDRCSAYGNRNFWIYYTDWFGSTQIPGAAEVTGRYAQTGGEVGPLGAIAANVLCGLRDGGCFQGYARGAIYWSPASGARIVYSGAVRDRWAGQGWETGALGYPVGDTVCGLRDGGCFQAFQGGAVYWSPSSGARVVSGAVRDRWAA